MSCFVSVKQLNIINIDMIFVFTIQYHTYVFLFESNGIALFTFRDLCMKCNGESGRSGEAGEYYLYRRTPRSEA